MDAQAALKRGGTKGLEDAVESSPERSAYVRTHVLAHSVTLVITADYRPW